MTREKHYSLSAFLLLLTALSVTGCVQISDPGSPASTATHSVNFAASAADDIDGSVAVSVATKILDSPGNHSPKNVVAIWIEDSDGAFVKTLVVRAYARIKYLYSWIDSQGSSTLDGITGATRSNHDTNLTATWDGTNIAGKSMKMDIYRLRGELTDHNGSGATFSVDIDLSGGAASSTPYTGNGFQSVTATYTVP